jgi:hypothetical protein
MKKLKAAQSKKMAENIAADKDEYETMDGFFEKIQGNK